MNQMMDRAARAAVGLVLAVALSACQEDFEQAAIGPAPDGTFRVHFFSCESHAQVADRVQLLVLEDPAFITGNDEVLWEAIFRDADVPGEVVSVGPDSLPHGVEEVVPPREPPVGQEVTLYLTTANGEAFHVAFRWGEIPAEGSLSEAGEMSETEWLGYAMDAC